MRNFFTTIIFLFSIIYVFPQVDFYAFNQKNLIIKIDSLKRVLPALKDIKRIDCLNDLSESYLQFHTDTARIYANQALKEADRITYIKGQAKAYKNLGRIEYILITDLPSAEKYFSKSLSLFITIHDEHEIAWAWEALGYSKWVLSKFPEAMEALEKAEQLFKKSRDTSNLQVTYFFMSSAALEWGHYAKSLEYKLKLADLNGKQANLSSLYAALGDYETALDYLRNTPPTDGMDSIFRNLGLGEVFNHKRQYDSAMHYYRLFSNYAKSAGAGPLIKLYTGLGQLHLGLKHYDTALAYLNAALKMGKDGKDQNQVMKVLLILSGTLKEKGDFERAKESVANLLQISNETGARQYLRDAHFLLYQIFDHFKKPDSAYLHLRKYTDIKDTIDLDLSAQKLAFYKTKSETEQAQSRINILNEEKKLQQQQLRTNSTAKKFPACGHPILIIAGRHTIP